MSANDVLSLEAHFAECSKRASNLKDQGVAPFEYYCVDQFLKQYPIADDDILAGVTGGPNDGGIDAIYFFVNRKVVDSETDIEPDTALRVNLVFFQVKEGSGFAPNEINKLYFFTDDLLNLTLPASTFKHKYNTRLIEVMGVFKTKYPKFVGAFPEVHIDYYYITKLDDVPLHPTAADASSRVIDKAKEHLSSADCHFHFIDAPKLWVQVQIRPPKAKPLQWVESMETPEGYVGLVKLSDYYLFLQDDKGDLYERIFESNVRGFQQNTAVNVGIRNTLKTPPEADFWLLNNGITILASKVETAGFKSVAIEDPQVVNGLQTSREVFAHYKGAAHIDASDHRRILVRVIKPSSSAVREDITRATNSQNKMPPAALRATDTIHGQIETVFRQHGLYYDRRPGQHKDEGRPIDKIISIVGLLQAMVAIVLGKPHDAYGAPGRYIRDDDQYNSVFGEGRYQLPLYLNVIKLQRRVDEFLQSDKLQLERGHRLRVRFYVATYLACAETGKAAPSESNILAIDADRIEDAKIEDSYKRVWKRYVKAGGDNIAAKSRKIFDSLQRELKKRFADVGTL